MAASGNTKLFHLLVATLLEHGAPMDLDQIIDRLERAGVQSGSTKLSTSVKRAWRGRRPVYRIDESRVGLDVAAPELDRILAILEGAARRQTLRGSRQLSFGMSAAPVADGRASGAREALDELLATVRRDGDLAEIVLRCPARDLKNALVDLCRERASEGRVRSIVTEGFEQLGLSGVEEPLCRLLSDRTSSIDARSLAAQVLGRSAPGLAGQVQSSLSSVDAMALVRADIAELGLAVLVEADNAFAVGEVLRAAPAERAMEFAAICGQARRDAGVPAAIMYRAALRQIVRADLREALIRAVVDEGGLAGERLLEALIHETQDARAKQALRGSLMRLRTRTAELIGAKGIGGRAWISSCDGQGAYWALAFVETPRAGLTLVQACVRAGRELRQVMVAPRATEDEARSVMAQLADVAALHFVEAPLREVADLVVRAARCNDGRAGRMDLSLEMLGAVALMERAAPGASLDPAKRVGVQPARGRITAERVRRLLARPEYLDSWFFAEEDLSQPDRDELGSLAARAPSEVIRVESLQPRLVAMAEHMALFHELGGDSGAAALCARLARDTERSIDGMLARAMLLETEVRLGPLPSALVDLAATSYDREAERGPRARGGRRGGAR